MGGSNMHRNGGWRKGQVKMHTQDNFLFGKGGNIVFIIHHVKVELDKIISIVKH